MPTIGIYFSTEYEQDEINMLRAALSEIAKRHGYIRPRAPGGQGSIGDLLIAIASGEVALVLLPDEHVTWAIEHLEAVGEEWADSIARALREAREREND
jgi:hypothetical protein